MMPAPYQLGLQLFVRQRRQPSFAERRDAQRSLRRFLRHIGGFKVEQR